MSWFEEVYKNKGGFFGAHSGKKYEKSDIETIGGIQYSKPCYVAPNVINLELEYDKADKPVEPHEKYEEEY